MKKNEIMKNIALKEHFATITGTPIAVFEEPYFSQRLETLDPLYGCKKKFETFVENLEEFETDGEYFARFHEDRYNAVEGIVNDPLFNKFLTDCTGKYDNEGEFASDEYVESCGDDNKTIHITMEEPFFAALAYAVPGIFMESKKANEFMPLYTTMLHLMNAENNYDILWSHITDNVKDKIQEYVYHLLYKMSRHLEKELGVKIGCISNSYIAFHVKEDQNNVTLAAVAEAVKSCPDGIGELFTVEMHENTFLWGFEGVNTKIYKINPETGEAECTAPLNVTAMDAALLPQIVKYYYGQEITDDDLVFSYAYHLSKFLEPIKNPWDESLWLDEE